MEFNHQAKDFDGLKHVKLIINLKDYQIMKPMSAIPGSQLQKCGFVSVCSLPLPIC